MTSDKLLLLLALTACGKSKSTEETKEPESPSATHGSIETGLAKFYATEADLPPCTEELQGHITYIRSYGEFFVCTYGEWGMINQ